MALNILGFLSEKNILVTGSTGFLGKIFIEKILRSQPGIGRIFVLLRANDAESAKMRFINEVLKLELFSRLREQHGDNFERFVFEKVVPVVGDIATDHNLGIDTESSREHLWRNLDAIVNIAASTVFDDRYDISLNVNTKGAENIVEFAKRCRNLQILLHVSTAYVVGRKSGQIKESCLKLGHTLMNSKGLEGKSSPPLSLDIEAEFGLLEKTQLKQQASSTTHTASTSSVIDAKVKRLKELGLERARTFGWPNTYSFTKAMGEMLIEKLRGNVPVVILRPTIIESTLAEPFPGWMEGTRTMDTVIIGYGKGQISYFLADPELILDVIPADMVVNAMIVAMVAHAYQNGLFVYHVASSVANPLRHSVAADEAYKYFSKHPCVGKDGNVIHVKQLCFLKSMSSFRQYMHRRYKAPLEVFNVVNKLLCCNFTERYKQMLRRYNKVMCLAELYEPYVFFNGRFDITNTEGLWKRMSEEDKKAFNFDANCIDWVRYFSDVHIPGLVKYVLK
eukprot:PITA_18958